MSSPSKLVELRRKTDRELPVLIQRELERGLTLASVAASSSSPLRKKADNIYEKMKALFPVVDGIDSAQRAQLESKLDELRAALDYPSDRGFASYKGLAMLSGVALK